MIERLHTDPDLSVQESEYRRMLGYPIGSEPSHRACEVIAATRQWYSRSGRPWIYFREVPLALSPTACRLDGIAFPSPKLHRFFRETGAKRAVVVAVSAGQACVDRAIEHWTAGRPDEYFFTEVYGSAVAEHLVDSVGGQVCELAERSGMLALPHYSPGYDGWDISEQGHLLELIAGGAHFTFPEPVEVLASGMLRPRKALLAIIGLTPRTPKSLAEPRLNPCPDCSCTPCDYRRAPYQHAAFAADQLPEANASPETPPDPAHAPPELQVNYSVGARALRKWSRERLQLDEQADGSIRARFRFDGSTCSNLGQPLAFIYTVVLAPADDAYRVLETSCRPAPGDDGHKHMCAFLRDSQKLMDRVGEPPPVAGEPLDAVLHWEREPRHTGCYCDPESHAHKWGLALETIHFALARRHIPASAVTPSTLSPQQT